MLESDRIINGVIIDTSCIVLFSVRKLAMQTFAVLRELMKHHNHTYELLMGMLLQEIETQKLSKGKNI